MRPVFALSALLLTACPLFESGDIESTCDELGTCGGISDGGVVFVEEDPNSSTGSWKVLLLDGKGDTLDSPSGQGRNARTVVYHEASDTIYLTVSNSIRLLRDDVPPKIEGFPGALDAIPSANGMYIATTDGVFVIDGESASVGTPLAVTRLLPAANPSTHQATYLDFAPQDVTLFEMVEKNGELLPEGGFLSAGSNQSRAHDAFAINGSYGLCSETGATFLIEDLEAGETGPDRYPSENFKDIVACDYEAETDEVVLFSKTQGVAWMDADGTIQRIIPPSDGFEIVHGTLW